MPAISMIATAAAVALLTPLAATAAPANSAAPVLLAATSGQAAAGVAPARRPTRYCFVDRITGSLIERRTCHTLNAWLAQGIDPRAAR